MEGTTMRSQIIAATVTTMAVSAGMIGFAGPATAAQDGNAGPWVMPDVRTETLSRAINSVLDVTGDVDLDLRILNRKNTQQVINYTNWEVCAQSPRGGSEISQKTMRVILAVRRPGTRGC
ncbi:hypothetical protein JDV09_24605 [Mycobacterium sp. Y57]|nr:hypothetical protein [Mycolicibacterium xanthum]